MLGIRGIQVRFWALTIAVFYVLGKVQSELEKMNMRIHSIDVEATQAITSGAVKSKV